MLLTVLARRMSGDCVEIVEIVEKREFWESWEIVETVEIVEKREFWESWEFLEFFVTDKGRLIPVNT